MILSCQGPVTKEVIHNYFRGNQKMYIGDNNKERNYSGSYDAI